MRVPILVIGLAACSAREVPVSHEVGPTITPTSALLAWLERSDRRVIQLPVTVVVSPLGVQSARIGAAPDLLPIRLDDTALGIPLADRLRDCGSGCAVWLEGTWGSLVPDPEEHVFAVRRVVGPVDGDNDRVRLVE